MKSFFFKPVFSLAIIFLLLLEVEGQTCLTSGGCSAFTNQYPSGTFANPSTQWVILQSTQGDALINAGNYAKFNVVQGNTYEWTYCETYGGVSTSWDAQLTLFNESNTSTPLCFSTDDCGTNSNAPYLRWPATFTGTVRILTTMFNGSGCRTNSGAPYNKMAWRLASSCTPVSFTNSDLPEDIDINEGSSAVFNVTVSGTPPFNYYWYKNNDVFVTSTVGTNATTNSCTIPNVSASEDGDTYKCVISNNCSSVPVPISRVARLNVIQTSCSPFSPDNLNATPVSANQINLTWMDNSSNETSFRIERSTSPGGSFSLVETVGANVISYQNTSGITPGVTYYYRVQACCNSTCSNYTNTADATTQSACSTPIPPSGLVAQAISASQINLSWLDNSNNENGFEIERSTSSSGSFAFIAAVGTGEISFSNTEGLSDGITYYYRVRACCNTNCSNYSNTSNATASSTAPTINSITFTNIIEGHAGVPREHNLYSGNPGSSNDPIKICADGSTSTFIKVNVSNPAGISFRILNEALDPISNIETEGTLGTQYTFGGTNVEVPLTHPKYLNSLLAPSVRFILQVLYNGTPMNGAEFPIDVYRAPVMFVHGLWGAKTSFMGKGFDNGKIFMVLRESMYPYFNSKPEVESRAPLFWFVDYSDINSAAGHFSEYDNTISSNIRDFLLNLRKEGFSSAKVDLVGHSMGGIVSRLYLQSAYYKNDIL